MALLRLAQGRVAVAAAAIARVMSEPHDHRTRARGLAAYVEIMLAANETASARAAAEELSTLAAAMGAPLLRAMSAQATGAVLLAEGAGRDALASLRAAVRLWHELDAPYDGARAAVLLARAHGALGDDDSAAMELEAAGDVFRRLGAAPDLARLGARARAAAVGERSPLTAREMQVLRLIATGKTNRAIADDLAISEKTVARHVSNIYSKLALSTRAAATAYAYEHELLKSST
jgi:DNA-binding NarL/FixJ family response regulator